MPACVTTATAPARAAVKTLGPAFNVVLSQLILGQSTPAPVALSLVPIMLGVALASASELSFNWLGFLTAMASNLTFGFRAVWGKRAMTSIKNLDSTANYAWTTLISALICVPMALIFEGPTLQKGMSAAIAKVRFAGGHVRERTGQALCGRLGITDAADVIRISAFWFAQRAE